MKKRSLSLSIGVLLIFCTIARAEDAQSLFLQMPSAKLKNVDRAGIITVNDASNNYLKLKISESFSGEFKILSKKKDEIIAGFSIYSCDESALEIWSVKKGIWKEVSAAAVPKLGAKDVTKMLKISPATIEKLDAETSIPYFYEFSAGNAEMKLVMRKQQSCDVAGTVYVYKFNGKKFAGK